MSYFKEIEYKILPNDSYKIIRNCSKCGCKTKYINTDKFRINANGNRIDVWLIYQCEKCRNTYNLAIYKRVAPSAISGDEYDRFMANDIVLASEYGNKKTLFAKNKAEIDLEHISYNIIQQGETLPQANDYIIIKNPFELNIRVDKVLSEILHKTRNQIKQLMKDEMICCEKNYVGQTARILLRGDIKA